MKIKNLKYIIIAATISLTGCSDYSSIESEEIAASIEYLENESEEIISSNMQEDDTVPNIYFEQNSKDEYVNYPHVTIDDIILTLEEKKIFIDHNQVQLFYDLNSHLEMSNNTDNEFQNLVLSFFDVEKNFEEAFNSNLITKTKNHLNSELYDSINNDIYWDKLLYVVNENNKKFLSNEEDNIFFRIYEYEAYNDDEIKIVIHYLHNFIDYVKNNYPEFDMKLFACHLSDLKLCHYGNDEVFDGLARTYTDGLISTYKYKDTYTLDFSKIGDIFNHEFKHFISSSCQDDLKKNLGTGFTTDNSNYNSTFLWRFLEEATANQLANNISGNKMQFYEDSCYLLDTIEMVNGFSGVKKGSILEVSIYHDPISLVQQFMIPTNNTQESHEWLIENLEMLACYSTLYSSEYYSYLLNMENKFNIAIDEMFYYNEEATVLDNESYQQFIYILEENANLQLLRLGIAGLAIMNQNYNQELTLEDHLYLLKLLDYRIHEQDIYEETNFNLTISHTLEYNTYYKSLLSSYFSYIAKEYNVVIEDVRDKYYDLNLETYILSNAFTEQEKEYYKGLYQEATYIDYTDEVMSNILEGYSKKIGTN